MICKTYGETLARARRTAGVTQAELAHHLGLSLTYVSYIERNKRRPFSYDQNVAIAERLECDVYDLLIAMVRDAGLRLDFPSVSNAQILLLITLIDYLNGLDDQTCGTLVEFIKNTDTEQRAVSRLL
jgi:transcriptional regulator with XRE-family HTH domain